MSYKKCLCILYILVASSVTEAKSLFNDVSLTLLRGEHYEVGDDSRTVATFEYVNSSSWGDYFMFIDRLEFDDGTDITYMELSPRLTIFEFENSFVKSVLLSATWENGETADNYLLGPAVDLNVPGFRYLKLNFYHRNNDNTEDSLQFSPVWAIPFQLGDEEWLYDGFIDWASATSGTAANLHFTSQLKWNIKYHLGATNNIYLGFEYTYWHNKFGIKNVTENNLNLLFKYHF